jgi:hypothetical protein
MTHGIDSIANAALLLQLALQSDFGSSLLSTLAQIQPVQATWHWIRTAGLDHKTQYAACQAAYCRTSGSATANTVAAA